MIEIIREVPKDVLPIKKIVFESKYGVACNIEKINEDCICLNVGGCNGKNVVFEKEVMKEIIETTRELIEGMK